MKHNLDEYFSEKVPSFLHARDVQCEKEAIFKHLAQYFVDFCSIPDSLKSIRIQVKELFLIFCSMNNCLCIPTSLLLFVTFGVLLFAHPNKSLEVHSRVLPVFIFYWWEHCVLSLTAKSRGPISALHIHKWLLRSMNYRPQILFRSGATFKLKLRLPVSELWLHNAIDGVSESNVAINKSFVIGWPTVSYVATFR